MPVICSLIQHGFLPVFSVVEEMMLYSNGFLKTSKKVVRNAIVIIVFSTSNQRKLTT